MFHYQLSENASLKLVDMQDAPAFFHIIQQSKEHLRPWMPWAETTTKLEDTENFIRASMQQFANNDGFQAGIWHDGKAAGIIGFHRIDWTNKAASVGYWLGEGFVGKGLITSAGRAVLDHAFQVYKLERIELRAANANKKSQAVAERLGFKQEGVIRRAEWVNGRYHDHVLYSLLKEEWI